MNCELTSLCRENDPPVALETQSGIDSSTLKLDTEDQPTPNTVVSSDMDAQQSLTQSSQEDSVGEVNANSIPSSPDKNDATVESENNVEAEQVDTGLSGTADGDEGEREAAQFSNSGEVAGTSTDVGTCEIGSLEFKRPAPGEAKKQRHQQPTLLTLFASNAAEQRQKSLEEDESRIIATTPAPPTPSLSCMDEFLLESDDKLTVDVPDSPPKPLTPMERFQHRLIKHMNTSLHPARKEKRPAKTKEESGEETGMRPLVPEEVITKLKDKPGEIIVCMNRYTSWIMEIRGQFGNSIHTITKCIEVHSVSVFG